MLPREKIKGLTHISFRLGASLCLSYCLLLKTMCYFKAIPFTQSWDTSVAIVSRVWAGLPTIMTLFLARERDCFLLCDIYSNSWERPPSYTTCTRSYFRKDDLVTAPGWLLTSVQQRGWENVQLQLHLINALVVSTGTTLPLLDTV